MTTQNPIGVFDSGIGGLSVLKQMMRFLPNENYIYLGDTARVPYGNKSTQRVSEYAAECTSFLLAKGVKMIVVACNTVSSVALDAVKSLCGDVLVVGMISPAAAAAVREFSSGRIGVIGTRATIASGAYEREIQQIAGKQKVSVVSKACPLFVPLVEEGFFLHEATRVIAHEYLDEYVRDGVDALVLGCTHYPLLHQLFTEMLPGVPLIDTGEHAAVTALRLLAKANLLNEGDGEFTGKPNADLYITDVPAAFHELAVRFLGFDVKQPTTISL